MPFAQSTFYVIDHRIVIKALAQKAPQGSRWRAAKSAKGPAREPTESAKGAQKAPTGKGHGGKQRRKSSTRRTTKSGQPGLAGRSIKSVFNRAGLFFRAEIFLADAAKLAGEIFGKLFPFYAGLFFIIDPTAYIADVFHCFSPFIEFLFAFKVYFKKALPSSLIGSLLTSAPYAY